MDGEELDRLQHSLPLTHYESPIVGLKPVIPGGDDHRVAPKQAGKKDVPGQAHVEQAFAHHRALGQDLGLDHEDLVPGEADDVEGSRVLDQLREIVCHSRFRLDDYSRCR